MTQKRTCRIRKKTAKKKMKEQIEGGGEGRITLKHLFSCNFESSCSMEAPCIGFAALWLSLYFGKWYDYYWACRRSHGASRIDLSAFCSCWTDKERLPFSHPLLNFHPLKSLWIVFPIFENGPLIGRLLVTAFNLLIAAGFIDTILNFGSMLNDWNVTRISFDLLQILAVSILISPSELAKDDLVFNDTGFIRLKWIWLNGSHWYRFRINGWHWDIEKLYYRFTIWCEWFI